MSPTQARGPVVVDTDVFSADLLPGSRLAVRYAPILAGRGAAPAYLMSLPETDRRALEESLRATLPRTADGGIELVARAWAVRGRVP